MAPLLAYSRENIDALINHLLLMSERILVTQTEVW